ncbi:MAG: tetratricopeptide repeat protein [Pseudomonadota bacterium]
MTRLVFGLGLLWLVADGALATQRGLHYGEVVDPSVVSCDLKAWHGATDEARTCYAQLLAKAEDPAQRAELAWALGDVKAANRWFRDAAAAAPESAAVRTRWGWLFVVTHQGSEAQALFTEALALDPDYAYAKLGLASVFAGSFSGEAANQLEPLLTDTSVAPGAAIRATLLAAWVALENGEFAAAETQLSQAEGMLRSSPWPALELLALRAAAAGLQDQPVEPFVSEALEIHRGYGDAWAIPAHFKVITRRYDKAGEWYARALEVQPNLWSARLEYGSNLLRLDQPAAAREQIRLAYEGDPYNAKTVNSLRLLDTLDQFDTREVPLPGAELKLRLHPEESEVLTPYVTDLTARGVKAFAERYRFAPQKPVVVEMYPDHEDFAVRTVGLPGVGILGATFGYVVAQDSPAARPPEGFHWGTTLWHEIAHIFTLKATDHRVTRWFSEGISVFEEWRTGPVPGRQIPLVALKAMAEDKLVPLQELEGTFVRPKYSQQVLVSYMQSGLICDFIEQEYGFDALVSILHSYRDGLDTEAAVKAAMGLELVDFDAAFTAFIDKEFGPTFEGLGGFEAAQREAAQAAAAEDWEQVRTAAAEAIEHLPQYAEADSPYLLLARAERALENLVAERAALQRYFAAGGRLPDALDRLAAGLHDTGAAAEAIEVLAATNWIAPLDAARHARLGRWLLDENRGREAVLEFKAALALNPHDQAAAYYDLARAYQALGDLEAARRSVLTALDQAPNYRDAQKLLMSLLSSS